jgi:hypothetical protein
VCILEDHSTWTPEKRLLGESWVVLQRLDFNVFPRTKIFIFLDCRWVLYAFKLIEGMSDLAVTDGLVNIVCTRGVLRCVSMAW